MEKRLKKAEFSFDSYLESMNQMKKLGGLSSVLGMMHGMGSSQMSQIESAMDDKKMGRIEGIIYSMTPTERANPAFTKSKSQESNCKRCWCGYCRSESFGETV